MGVMCCWIVLFSRLNQGPITRPTGEHWSLIVGIEPEALWMHDPNEEPLLVSGGHIRGSRGNSIRCSWKNFLQRWEVEGPRTGWYLTCSR